MATSFMVSTTACFQFDVVTAAQPAQKADLASGRAAAGRTPERLRALDTTRRGGGGGARGGAGGGGRRRPPPPPPTRTAAAFRLSFTTLRDLGVLARIPADDAWLFPLIVDGTILLATAG
ncbi:DUF2637 domain-containing protein, partial [Nocardia gipuzkoensis]|uniref:DUF2637 domain-containing protein n=1 Tax=Nocardia gipuzkoensis TaxID=2749991 RepID=UPI002453F683